MSNKIYQVWGADEEVPGTTSIYYVSSNYDSAVDYVIGIISKREAENVKRAIDFNNKKSAEIKLMNDQIRVLDQIVNNDVIKPIIDPIIDNLRTKRAKEVAYSVTFGKSDLVEHDTEYYKAHFKHYCIKHHLYIADFNLDTAIRACAEDYINEVQGYTY